jgi:hypothetical protein
MCYVALDSGTWADWTLGIVSLIGGIVAWRLAHPPTPFLSAGAQRFTEK